MGGEESFFRLFGEAGTQSAAAEYYPLIMALPHCPLPGYLLRCDTLLLWNDDAERLLPLIYAASVVSCGFSACCTLTPASMEQGCTVLTVQRELRRLDGSIVLPQDILLREWRHGITDEEQIVLAGLHLLIGNI